MNKKLIRILIEMILTVIFTISVSYAWFVTNSVNEAEGIGAVSDQLNYSTVGLKRYIASFDSKNQKYSLGQNLDVASDPLPFSIMESYDKVIYEIETIPTKNQIRLDIANLIPSRNSMISKQNGKYYNYLSNVAKFTFLGIDEENLAPQEFYDSTYEKSLTFVEDAHTKTEEIKLLELNVVPNRKYKMYLLFDYNQDNINRIYALNLGSEGANASRIMFKEDIEWRLR